MESALASFLSVETIVFCIVVALACMVLKKVITFAAGKIAYIFPDKWEPRWMEAWKVWILPAMPVVVGGLIAFFASMYPFPEAFAGSDMGRVFFGLVAGLASGHAYPFFKHYLQKFLPKAEE